MRQRYELKLATGAFVEWEGSTGEGAAQNYASSHPEAIITAWREVRHGLFLGTQRIKQ